MIILSTIFSLVIESSRPQSTNTYKAIRHLVPQHFFGLISDGANHHPHLRTNEICRIRWAVQNVTTIAVAQTNINPSHGLKFHF